MRRLLTLVLLLPALALCEEEAVENMTLTVKPLLCITDNRNPSCDMAFLVAWQSALTGYYCLFSDLDDVPVRCWNEERMGQLSDERTVRENFSYWMTDRDPGSRLAEVTVEVLRMDSDDRRRKRRTRHVWDIN
ncbi:MAG: DUF3019 domain-containing protein [Gammaproteobacteria bacterium]|nr:DUF3019 domain-containing protein [Gammaproteobacteria bacterium]